MSDEKVIDITDRLNARRMMEDRSGILTCECQSAEENPTGFFPVIVQDTHGDVIAGLACASCGYGWNVENGRLKE